MTIRTMRSSRSRLLAAAMMTVGLLATMPAAAEAASTSLTIHLSDGGSCEYDLSAASVNLTSVSSHGSLNCSPGLTFTQPQSVSLGQPSVFPAVRVSNSSYGSGAYNQSDTLNSGSMYCGKSWSCSRYDTTTVVPETTGELDVSQRVEMRTPFPPGPVTFTQVVGPEADRCNITRQDTHFYCTVHTSTTDPVVIVRDLTREATS